MAPNTKPHARVRCDEPNRYGTICRWRTDPLTYNDAALEATRDGWWDVLGISWPAAILEAARG